MCTAIHLKSDNTFFGRTLDMAETYNTTLTFVPRRFTFTHEHFTHFTTANAILGISYVHNGYPLFFDAVNEHGLAVAGLKFEKNACYHNSRPGFDNIASFEFIPKLLSECKNIRDARLFLKNINITSDDFNPELKSTPLHWMIADFESSIVAEPLKNGLKVYENTLPVMTNDPDYQTHKDNQKTYFDENSHPLKTIPADNSSKSRFVRTLYNIMNSSPEKIHSGNLSRFFHIASKSSVLSGEDKNGQFTLYTSCCNLKELIYYYRTYRNSQICAVDFDKLIKTCNKMTSFPMIDTQHVYTQN